MNPDTIKFLLSLQPYVKDEIIISYTHMTAKIPYVGEKILTPNTTPVDVIKMIWDMGMSIGFSNGEIHRGYEMRRLLNFPEEL